MNAYNVIIGRKKPKILKVCIKEWPKVQSRWRGLGVARKKLYLLRWLCHPMGCITGQRLTWIHPCLCKFMVGRILSEIPSSSRIVCRPANLKCDFHAGAGLPRSQTCNSLCGRLSSVFTTQLKVENVSIILGGSPGPFLFNTHPLK